MSQLINQASNESVSYSVLPVASLPKEVEAGKAVVKFKTADKKQYFVVLPEVTDNWVQGFILNPKGMEAVKDYIETLQAKKAKQVYERHGRSICGGDLVIEELAQVALASSENVRLTKELIESQFKAEWKNTIAYALVLERDASAAALLLGEDTEAKAAFWNSEKGMQYLAVAQNYLQFLLYGAERKASFMSQAIKDKVLIAVGYLDAESVSVQKLVTRLAEIPVATVDDIAL